MNYVGEKQDIGVPLSGAGVTIGITYAVSEEDTRVEEGLKQNLYCLRETLLQIPQVEAVYFVTWSAEEQVDFIGNVVYAGNRAKVYLYKDIIEKTSILIEGSLPISKTMAEEVKQQGSKLISYQTGWHLAEKKDDLSHWKKLSMFDSVWLQGQLKESEYAMYRIVIGDSVCVVPLLWLPDFIEEKVREEGLARAVRYRSKRNKKRRVSLIGGDISQDKRRLAALLLTETAYQQDSALFASIRLYDTDIGLKEAQKNMAESIPIIEDIPRSSLLWELEAFSPYELAKQTDVIVDNTIDTVPPYLSLEVLYYDYPVVHSNAYLKKHHIGYYYECLNVLDGVKQLVSAISEYDTDIREQRRANKHFLDEVSPYYPSTSKRYEEAIFSILYQPVKA